MSASSNDIYRIKEVGIQVKKRRGDARLKKDKRALKSLRLRRRRRRKKYIYKGQERNAFFLPPRATCVSLWEVGNYIAAKLQFVVWVLARGIKPITHNSAATTPHHHWRRYVRIYTRINVVVGINDRARAARSCIYSIAKITQALERRVCVLIFMLIDFRVFYHQLSDGDARIYTCFISLLSLCWALELFCALYDCVEKK